MTLSSLQRERKGGIKMQLSKVVEFHNLYSTLKEKEMPVLVAYKLNQIEDVCEKNNKFFEEKTRDIINKYAEKDSDGKPLFTEDQKSVRIQQDFIDTCVKELQELSEIDVDVPDIKIDINDLNDIKITVAEMSALMPFIKDKE